MSDGIPRRPRDLYDLLMRDYKTKLENDALYVLVGAITNYLTVSNPTYTGTLSGPKTRFTAEGGLAIKLTNKTGSASVKGSVVALSTGTDNAFALQSNEFDAIGVVYESGIADASECWVVVSGIAEVLLKDTTASTRGNWVISADTDGRADATQPTPTPNTTLEQHTVHFKEIGHCLESKVAGTNVLAKCVLHFN